MSSATPRSKVLSDAERDHFNAIPWARSILQSSLHDDYDAIEMPARTLKTPSDEDGYVAGTLATKETIPYIATLRRRNFESVVAAGPLPREPPPATTKSSAAATPSRPPDTITLVSMSAPGLSGHTGTAHGGVIATLFDEVMYLVTEAWLSASPAPDTERPREKIYTAQLNVRYRNPVSTPGLLVIRSWCIARAGRKYWTMAQALQLQQGEGSGQPEELKKEIICAEATSLWVVIRDEKL